jgi:hypothetical protein
VLCKDADLRLFLESDTFSLDVCVLFFSASIAEDVDRSSDR